MGRLLFVMIAVGCGQGSFNKLPFQDGDVGEPNYGERCGDGVDNDGDGLIDEDCAPSLFTGVYAPMVAADPALAALEAAAGHPLAVVQTYHATNAAGIANIAPDLAAIFARGQVANLNLEPTGYSPTQYASPNDFPISDDLSQTANAIASALTSAPRWPHVEASHEIRRAKVRRHPYLVVYSILPDQLVVLAIAHTSKHPGYWRERIKK